MKSWVGKKGFDALKIKEQLLGEKFMVMKPFFKGLTASCDKFANQMHTVALLLLLYIV